MLVQMSHLHVDADFSFLLLFWLNVCWLGLLPLPVRELKQPPWSTVLKPMQALAEVTKLMSRPLGLKDQPCSKDVIAESALNKMSPPDAAAENSC